MNPTPSARRRRRAFKVFAALATWGAVELVCHLELERRFPGAGASAELSQKQRATIERALAGGEMYLVPDGELGWTIAPSVARGHPIVYRSNAAGMRSDREVAPEPPDGIVRAVLMGESFTHCDEVEYEDTWGRGLERRLPRLEALNLGVCAYGPDQALLRFRREGARLKPRLALLGIMTENLNRVVNTYRPFYVADDGIGFGKPRFELADGDALRLLPNPLSTHDDYRRLLADPARELPRIGERDDFWVEATGARRWLPSLDLLAIAAGWRGRASPLVTTTAEGFKVFDARSESFRLLVAIGRAFHAEAAAAGATPFVVLFPLVEELPQLRAGGPPIYEPLRAALEAAGVPCIDIARRVSDGLESTGGVAGRHYTPATNDRVAQAILEALRERAPALVADAARPR